MKGQECKCPKGDCKCMKGKGPGRKAKKMQMQENAPRDVDGRPVE